MSSFEHDPRGVIIHPGQHLYKHPPGNLSYTNPSLPNISSVAGALDWLVQVIYPYPKDSVPTPGDLPAAGNTLNDYRVVDDDGDGKAAGYQWQQREGDAAAKWYKIYDMDWGYDQILSGFLNKTLDFYVYKHGYDDLDDTGTPLAGVDSGQHIFGGASASTNLTLHANSGDGVGAQTGYVQFADNARPQVDDTWELGTATEQWKKIWSHDAKLGTLNFDGNTITADGGTVDFVDDIITTGEAIFGGNIRINSSTIYNPGVDATREVAYLNGSDSDFLSTAVGDFAFDGSTDFSIAVWFNLQSKTDTSLSLGPWWPGSNERTYAILYVSSDDRWDFRISPNGSSQFKVVADTYGSPNLNTWAFIACRYVSGVGLYISINDGGEDFQAYTSVINVTAQDFTLGASEGVARADNYIANLGIWNRSLSAAEITALYNQGGGKEYANLTVGEKINLISYWNMDESSDGTGPVTRVDSYGTNDFTDESDTNSVTWVRFLGGGAISFDDDDLQTTGEVQAASFHTSGASSFGSGTTIGNMTISDGQIECGNEDNNISFVDNNLSTTGTFTAAQVNVDDLRMDANGITVQTADTNLDLTANGTGTIRALSTLTTGTVNTTGTMTVTGQFNADNLRLDGNTLSSTSGVVAITPATGSIQLGATTIPAAGNSHDLGASSFEWRDLFVKSNIKDGTNTFTVPNLMTFSNVGSPSLNDSLFWDGAKWVASAADSEIAHSGLGGITTGDAGHTQFVMLLGRDGGQTIDGGTAASENLTLTSTTHATKGNIVFSDTARPAGDNAQDLGGSSNYFRDIYVKGQLKGARAENFTTAGRPSASAGTAGRLIWDTDLLDLLVDIGGSWLKMSLDKWQYEDATTWEGTATTVTYTVDGSVNPERGRVTDARKCIWQFKDNSNSHQVVSGVTIDHPSSTQVRVTVGVALPAGTYRLIGIG